MFNLHINRSFIAGFVHIIVISLLIANIALLFASLILSIG